MRRRPIHKDIAQHIDGLAAIGYEFVDTPTVQPT
jgi:hypothetical protein